jgi:hypothetical protein
MFVYLYTKPQNGIPVYLLVHLWVYPQSRFPVYQQTSMRTYWYVDKPDSGETRKPVNGLTAWGKCRNNRGAENKKRSTNNL